jgi:hypothetical protein
VQNEIDIVRDVSARLERAGIDYMLTGSMAMNYYAQPRMTRDIDMVLALNMVDAPRVVQLFRPDYYLSEDFETWIVSKEDLILSKLFWGRDSRSQVHMRDVKNLMLTACDMSYIERWTRELGVHNLWEELSHE